MYYATWNQKAQRLDYVSQTSILQLGPWSWSLVYTHAEESLSVHRRSLSVLRGMASGSYRLFCSPVLWEWYQMGTYLSAKFCWLLCLQRTWLEEYIYTQVGDTKSFVVWFHLLFCWSNEGSKSYTSRKAVQFNCCRITYTVCEFWITWRQKWACSNFLLGILSYKFSHCNAKTGQW